MLIRKLSFLFLICCLILAGVPSVLCVGSASIVYVAGDGSGDFSCDGTDDHVQINQALEYATNNPGTVVHLKGPFTYTIDSPLIVGSYTTLEGDSNAVIKLADKAAWGSAYVGMIKSIDNAHNITIQGFEIDGNEPGQTDLGDDSRGSGYYPMIGFETGAYNILIQNMYFHNGCSDAARIKYSSSLSSSNPGNVIFRNNKVYKSGHEGLYCIGINGVTAYNNDIFTWIDSAFRLHNSNHAKIYGNTIYSELSGHSTGPGIEIQRTSSKNVMDDIEIYDNTFNTLNGAGIWFGEGADTDNTVRGRGVYIHDNIFHNVGQYWYDTGYSNAGIVLGQWANTRIENNIIDNGGKAGIDTYIETKCSEVLKTTIKNNIIMNCDVGIDNSDTPGQYTFEVQNNCIYNNGVVSKGNGVTLSSNIFVDPLLDSNYLLKDSSPCISLGIGVNVSTNSATNNSTPSTNNSTPSTNNSTPSTNNSTPSLNNSTTLPTNIAPSMSNIGNKTIKVGSKLSFKVLASDKNGDKLTYSVVNLPKGATFKNAIFTWTPTYKQVGTYKVTFRVSDGKLTNSRTTSIKVVRR